MTAGIRHSQLSAGSGSSLWVFVLASSLAHACALMLWPASPPAGLPGGGVLQVRLERGADAGDGQDEEPTSNDQASRFAHAQPKAYSETETSLAVTKTPTTTAVADSADTAVEQSSDSAIAVKHSAPARHLVKAIPKQSSETALASTATDSAALDPVQVKRSSAQQGTAETRAAATKRDNDGPAADAALAASTAASPVTGERSGTAGDANQMIQAALREALLPHFDYPLLARRRGWEGRVRIALLVQPDGDLTDMQVLESSGYRVLDQAALRDLRELGRLPQAIAWLDGKQMGLVLPIQYRFE